jgi:hypothetical protein
MVINGKHSKGKKYKGFSIHPSSANGVKFIYIVLADKIIGVKETFALAKKAIDSGEFSKHAHTSAIGFNMKEYAKSAKEKAKQYFTTAKKHIQTANKLVRKKSLITNKNELINHLDTIEAELKVLNDLVKEYKRSIR